MSQNLVSYHRKLLDSADVVRVSTRSFIAKVERMLELLRADNSANSRQMCEQLLAESRLYAKSVELDSDNKFSFEYTKWHSVCEYKRLAQLLFSPRDAVWKVSLLTDLATSFPSEMALANTLDELLRLAILIANEFTACVFMAAQFKFGPLPNGADRFQLKGTSLADVKLKMHQVINYVKSPAIAKQRLSNSGSYARRRIVQLEDVILFPGSDSELLSQTNNAKHLFDNFLPSLLFELATGAQRLRFPALSAGVSNTSIRRSAEPSFGVSWHCLEWAGLLEGPFRFCD